MAPIEANVSPKATVWMIPAVLAAEVLTVSGVEVAVLEPAAPLPETGMISFWPG